MSAEHEARISFSFIHNIEPLPSTRGHFTYMDSTIELISYTESGKDTYSSDDLGIWNATWGATEGFTGTVTGAVLSFGLEPLKLLSETGSYLVLKFHNSWVGGRRARRLTARGIWSVEFYDINGDISYFLTKNNSIVNTDFTTSTPLPPPATIPIPSAVWFFCSGILGLLRFSRNQKM